jgi:hypothetical protein
MLAGFAALVSHARDVVILPVASAALTSRGRHAASRIIAMGNTLMRHLTFAQHTRPRRPLETHAVCCLLLPCAIEWPDPVLRFPRIVEGTVSV